MERNGDENKKNDAQILAQLRRRSAPVNLPEDGGDFWFDESSVSISRPSVLPLETPAEASSVLPLETSLEPSSVLPLETPAEASSDATSRSEALRRLVAQGAPKEPMSALSPTLRSLREELNSADAATFATTFDDKSDFADDAALDLLESTLDAENWKDEHGGGERPTNVADDNGREEGAARELAEIDDWGDLSDLREIDVPETGNASSDAARRSNETEEDEKLENRGKSVNLAFPAESVLSTSSAPSSHFSVLAPEPQEANVAQPSVSDLMVVSNLKKGYVKGKKLIPVLQGVDLTARQGELLAIVGQSGSGKSTLLHLMGTLDAPDSGTIHFDGQRIDNLSTAQRDVLRNHFIGMIFQFYHLIPEMTTLENVLAPLMIRESFLGYWSKKREYVARAKELLALVGLSHRLKHRPNELSGGEMQRASIARALISNPRVLLADEPTGNLDSKASAGVLKLLRQLNEEQNLTIVMVTHDMSQAADADRAIRLVDGLVVPE